MPLRGWTTQPHPGDAQIPLTLHLARVENQRERKRKSDTRKKERKKEREREREREKGGEKPDETETNKRKWEKEDDMCFINQMTTKATGSPNTSILSSFISNDLMIAKTNQQSNSAEMSQTLAHQ